ncbi:hypothetical protein GRX03_01695 [Halovenus sp. WSH3]|uniref:DUF8080 domain-containing protein n=1 Tax=Halovenus carboxidivorans TaxID=2692199 RepID=A0A6B0T4A2_9EURY|nr:hypothetical protein [Halovenus carboxidivorans]MXR50323.1 hypothetical protein [Halovenus carboxidivorans]
MATLEWTCERIDGVTLVELTVTSERATRVRVESTLRPVWPPRRQGRPAAGWDGPVFEAEVDEDERLVVGYASPAERVDPPAEVTTRPPEEEEVDPADVIRALGDGTPPRDAVPTGGTSAESAVQTDTPERESARQEADPDPSATQRGSVGPGPSAAATGVPPAIEAYFEGLERRIAAAEELTESGTVDGAREAVRTAGGMGAVEGLDRQLRADRRHLDHLVSRTERLAGRLDAVDVPVERLERVA